MSAVLNSIQAADRNALPVTCRNSRDVLYSRPWHQLSAGVGRRAEAQGNLYIHAEGYAAGELKHGPIALIDEDMPRHCHCSDDRFFRKTGVEHAGSRGARRPDRVLHRREGRGPLTTLEGPWRPIVLRRSTDHLSDDLFAPRPADCLPHGRLMGTDVDQPRNLAKSVTVASDLLRRRGTLRRVAGRPRPGPHGPDNRQA